MAKRKSRSWSRRATGYVKNQLKPENPLSQLRAIRSYYAQVAQKNQSQNYRAKRTPYTVGRTEAPKQKTRVKSKKPLVATPARSARIHALNQRQSKTAEARRVNPVELRLINERRKYTRNSFSKLDPCIRKPDPKKAQEKKMDHIKAGTGSTYTFQRWC